MGEGHGARGAAGEDSAAARAAAQAQAVGRGRRRVGRRSEHPAPGEEFSDLLLAQARDARRLTDDWPPLCEEDEEPDDPEVRRAEQGPIEEDVDLTAQLQLAIGPFTIPTASSKSPSRRARRSRRGR